jgi:transitional endoplasmic reticulum ATPase
VLDLTARYYPSALDQRRGVVRLHPDALTALGLSPWDVIVLHGKRTTGGLVALAPPGHAQHELLCDELVLGNLGVPDGSTIGVERGADREAITVTVNAPQNVLTTVSAEMLRTALLGKALTSGDQVSLVPQDLAPMPAVDVVATTRSLSNLLGPAWSTLLLSIASVSPAGPAVVTMGTVVGFQGGTTTTGSATPLVLPTSGEAAVPLELPGLETQVASLTEWLDLGFHRKDLLAKLGSSPQLGVLITGGAGSGKTALVEAVAAKLSIRVVRAWGPTLAGLETSAAAKQITSFLEDASCSSRTSTRSPRATAASRCARTSSEPSARPSQRAGRLSSAPPRSPSRSARTCGLRAPSTTSCRSRCPTAGSG